MDFVIPPWVNLVAIAVASGFSIYGAFYKGKKEIVKEADEMDSKLIILLKETVAALEKRVSDLERRLTEALTTMGRLQAENTALQIEKGALASAIQGRDAQGAEMMKQSMTAIQQIAEILAAVREVREVVKHRVAVVTKENI